jgi:hypothetical protein
MQAIPETGKHLVQLNSGKITTTILLPSTQHVDISCLAPPVKLEAGIILDPQVWGRVGDSQFMIADAAAARC